MNPEWNPNECNATPNEFAKKSIGEIIREARQKKGLKQDALAAVLGVVRLRA